MKVSKVVIIVVALHVLVIGGIFIFEGCTRAKAPAPDFAKDENPADATNTTAALPTDNTAPQQAMTPVAPTAPQPTVQPPAAPAPVAKTYVVKKNDTLWKVAKAEHVSIGELARANNLTKNSVLKLNQKLSIPAKAEMAAHAAPAAPTGAVAQADPAAPAAAAVGGSTYTVKSGDSLWKIAKAEHVSVTAIKQANKLTGDSLKVDQKLTIPAGATATTAPAVMPASTTTTPAPQASATTASYGEWQPGAHSENGQTFHIVDINENLTTIAKKYGVKVDDLMKANNLGAGKQIAAGQKLVIPAASTPVSSATPAITTPIVTSSN